MPLFLVRIPKGTRIHIVVCSDFIEFAHSLRVRDQGCSDNVRCHVGNKIDGDSLDHQYGVFQLFQQPALCCFAPAESLLNVMGRAGSKRMAPCSSFGETKTRLVGFTKLPKQALGLVVLSAAN